MSKQVSRRRGSAAQHGTFVGAAGEITVDTTNNRIIIHDGTTVGGITGLKRDDVFNNGYPRLNDPAGTSRFDSSSTQTFVNYTAGNSAVLLDDTSFLLDTPNSVDAIVLTNTNFNLYSPENGTFTASLHSGSMYVGPGNSLETNATDGFLHIPTIKGIPNGTPNKLIGYSPVVFNSGNGRLYVYNTSGKWWYSNLIST